MPDEPDEITVAGQAVVDMLGACAAAPDDVATGRAADAALTRLERLLAFDPTDPTEKGPTP